MAVLVSRGPEQRAAAALERREEAWHGRGKAVTEGQEDRSNWRYEENGPPLVTVAAFLHWLDHLPASDRR